ncbi:MAG: inositol monophosphatase family protein [Longimicrobiales bacterium]|nr:inositol monophosphatase family protein [Longimicrobiales bacterium]
MSDLPSRSQLEDWLLTAREAAEEAAIVHAERSGRIGVADAAWKRFADFVSEVDLAAQEAALDVIRRHHPDHAILAEEGDEATTALPDDATPIWIVDPLDGTANFLHGHPFFAASVAVAISGQVMAGAVTAHALGMRWWARRDGGAFVNGHPACVSPRDTLEGALIGTGFPFKAQEELDTYGNQLGRVLSAGAQVRRAGAAAIDLCFVADGRFEGFWEGSLHSWDFAAGLVIVEEAGGVVARTDGTPLDLAAGSVAAAASPTLLTRLLERVEVAGPVR